VVAEAAEVAVDASHVRGREEERRELKCQRLCPRDSLEPRLADGGHSRAVDYARGAVHDFRHQVDVEVRPPGRHSHGNRDGGPRARELGALGLGVVDGG
jgi:hypothetical protein